jgi:hypothetical protein
MEGLLILEPIDYNETWIIKVYDRIYSPCIATQVESRAAASDVPLRHHPLSVKPKTSNWTGDSCKAIRRGSRPRRPMCMQCAPWLVQLGLQTKPQAEWGATLRISNILVGLRSHGISCGFDSNFFTACLRLMCFRVLPESAEHYADFRFAI